MTFADGSTALAADLHPDRVDLQVALLRSSPLPWTRSQFDAMTRAPDPAGVPFPFVCDGRPGDPPHAIAPLALGYVEGSCYLGSSAGLTKDGRYSLVRFPACPTCGWSGAAFAAESIARVVPAASGARIALRVLAAAAFRHATEC